MILTVVVGNSNTEFAWFRGRRLLRTVRIATRTLRDGRMPGLGSVAGVALASVVPEVAEILRARLRDATGLEPFVVGPRTRTGLTFRYRRRDLGADRVCVAVGARRRFPGRDLIVLDFGTATTVNIVLRDGVFAGGAILPGIQMCLDSLAAGTARLPRLLPGRKLNLVQHNTRAAVRAGIATLYGGGIDRIIDRGEHDLGRQFFVVATGGAAGVARRYTRRIGIIRPHLASEGLAELWRLNHRM